MPLHIFDKAFLTNSNGGAFPKNVPNSVFVIRLRTHSFIPLSTNMTSLTVFLSLSSFSHWFNPLARSDEATSFSLTTFTQVCRLASVRDTRAQRNLLPHSLSQAGDERKNQGEKKNRNDLNIQMLRTLRPLPAHLQIDGQCCYKERAIKQWIMLYIRHKHMGWHHNPAWALIELLKVTKSSPYDHEGRKRRLFAI